MSQVFTKSRKTGEVRLLPEKGVFLDVTNDRKVEIVFGFYRYPEGVGVIPTGLSGWRFRGHVTLLDPRYLSIAERFADAGYLDQKHNE